MLLVGVVRSSISCPRLGEYLGNLRASTVCALWRGEVQGDLPTEHPGRYPTITFHWGLSIGKALIEHEQAHVPRTHLGGYGDASLLPDSTVGRSSPQ